MSRVKFFIYKRLLSTLEDDNDLPLMWIICSLQLNFLFESELMLFITISHGQVKFLV